MELNSIWITAGPSEGDSDEIKVEMNWNNLDLTGNNFPKYD
jgi:hypothetical protein